MAQTQTDRRFSDDRDIQEQLIRLEEPGPESLKETAARKEANGLHMLIGLAMSSGLMAALISIPLAIGWLVLNLAIGIVVIRTARATSRQECPSPHRMALFYGILAISSLANCSAAFIFYFLMEHSGALAAFGYLNGVLVYIIVNYSASAFLMAFVSIPFVATLIILPLIALATPPGPDAADLVFCVSGLGSALSFLVASQIALRFNAMLNTSIKETEAERQMADEALTRLSDALGETGMGLYDFDVNANSIRLSDFAQTVLGPTDEMAMETLRYPTRRHVHPDDADALLTQIRKVRAGQQSVFDATYRIQDVDREGRIRWMRSRGIARYNPDGSMSRFIGSLTDVTQEIWMQAHLEEARKAAESASAGKSAFLATMSHEIRTPMNGVLGMAQALGQTRLDPTQRDMVDVISECGGSLLSILNDVLDISKIESGRMTLSPVEDNLRDVVTGVLQLWEPSAQDKGLTLDATLPDDLPPGLTFDPVRVRQCLSNLVSNAVKFTERGSISVDLTLDRTTTGPHAVTITVTDTGMGIPEHAQEKLFAPFVQADTSTARHQGGTGLGLSISRSLARLMGGDLTVASTPGHGSVFTLRFAVDAARSGDDSRKTAALDPTIQSNKSDDVFAIKDIKVLVVDDNDTNRQVAHLFLDFLGARITDAADGQEALDALEREAFDLVLLDMHMPIMDGAQTLRRMRDGEASWSDVPVIALTADAMVGDRERCLSLGADGYVAKPIELADLQAEITRVMA
ncbi:MAG: ATP-binding protein [Alphaproteobacteria bacterium]